MKNRQRLSLLPQVDECLKSPSGLKWLESYPRKLVIRAIREVIDKKRMMILEGADIDPSLDSIAGEIRQRIEELAAYRLRPVINATGVVIHTNLGRSLLPDAAVDNIVNVACRYTNLEYDIPAGKRGKRYSHIKEIIKELTGAEDAVAVNNNAAAVLLCLDTLARGREVIISRGELVEIGGSFRVPEVMESSGAILREVGTTNKTHLSDYRNALCGNTGMLLKVHQSNYRIRGFTEEVSIRSLVQLGTEYGIPVVADLGSGCLVDLTKYGIHDEPTVQDVLREGADLVTFSGDKLLGGPQAGIIAGKRELVREIQKNPMMRAMRIDKMTMAAIEAVFMQYLDPDRAMENIPTLRMLTASPESIRRRARKMLNAFKNDLSGLAHVEIVPDQSRAGGGSLPEIDFPTYCVAIRPAQMKVNDLERRLRTGTPPVIARIREDTLLIDARTVQDVEVKILSQCIITAIRDQGAGTGN
jgi:L-seryl-tRNA(Ser) seleniumtransferase